MLVDSAKMEDKKNRNYQNHPSPFTYLLVTGMTPFNVFLLGGAATVASGASTTPFLPPNQLTALASSGSGQGEPEGRQIVLQSQVEIAAHLGVGGGGLEKVKWDICHRTACARPSRGIQFPWVSGYGGGGGVGRKLSRQL